MFASLSTIALPLLLLSPFASASHVKRSSHARHAKRDAAPASVVEEAITPSNATHSLEKRQSFGGRGTFYYVNVGPGACGQWGNNDDYTVALNSAQYCCGYPGPHCFQTITVQANGVTVGGVRIMDECPTCGYGDLDLSPGLFRRFADESAGVVSLNWWFDNGSPQPEPTTKPPPPPPTSTWHEPSPTPAPWTPSPSPPAPTSTWSPPPPPPPSSSSTSTWVAPSTMSSAAPTTTSSSTVISSSTTTTNSTTSARASSTNAFAILSSVSDSLSGFSTQSGSATASASASGAETTHTVEAEGSNLQAVAALIANYGQMVVVGGGAQ